MWLVMVFFSGPKFMLADLGEASLGWMVLVSMERLVEGMVTCSCCDGLSLPATEWGISIALMGMLWGLLNI